MTLQATITQYKQEISSMKHLWEQAHLRMESVHSIRHADIPSLLLLAEESLTFAQSIGDIHEIVGSLEQIAICEIYQNNLSQALIYLLRAYHLTGRLPNQINSARILLSIGFLYADLGKHHKALKVFTRLLSTSEDSIEQETLWRILIAIGNIHRELSEYGKALCMYHRSLEIMEGRDDLIGICLCNMAGVYSLVHDYQQSLPLYERSRTASREAGDTWEECLTLIGMGKDLIGMRKYVQAIHFLEHALELRNQLDLPPYSVLLLLGEAYERQGYTEKALDYYREALHNATETNDRLQSGVAHAYIGRVHAAIHRYETALHHLLQSQSLLQPNAGMRHLLFVVYKLLSEIYERSGDVSKALEYHKLYHQIREEVLHPDRQRVLSETELQFEIARKEREKETYQTQNSQLQQHIEYTTRELQTATLHLKEKNILLEQADGEIRRILQTHTDKSVLQNLLQRMHRSINTSQDWQLFERQFERIHSTFFFSLIKRHPSLSPAELKICALLKMQLSSKEIGTLLTLSDHTMASHRCNIRRKLGLRGNMNLITYLSSL